MYLALVREDGLHRAVGVDTLMFKVTVSTPGDYAMHKKAREVKWVHVQIASILGT